MDQATKALTMAGQAGYTVIESGVLGAVIILQFILIAFLVVWFGRIVLRFVRVIERIPCLDENTKTICEYDRKEKRS